MLNPGPILEEDSSADSGPMPEDASGVVSGPMPEGEPMQGRESGAGSGVVGPTLFFWSAQLN